MAGQADSGVRVPRGKRVVDLLALVLLTPFLAPVAAVIAIAVFLDSHGSVIYWAARVGAGGRPFSMLKFRTMKIDVTGSSIAAADDYRITPVGRFLRATRLDELPQLWNVLRGEMSLVGPRPELEEFVALHADEYREILAVPPGLTGPTQLRFAGMEARMLNGHPDPDSHYREELLPDKVAMDLEYARSRSLRGDLADLARTVALPLILVWQEVREVVPLPDRSPLYAGAVLVAATLPLLFAMALGAPR